MDLLIVAGERERFATLEHTQGERQKFSVAYCANTDAAIERLQRRQAHVVIAGLDQTADQAALFAGVRAACPGAVRLALSAAADVSVPGAHQVVNRDLRPDDLLAVLESAASVAQAMAGDRVLRDLLSDLEDIPSPPSLYFDVREQIQSHTGTTAEMARIAARDPALVARTLKVANSGYFARPKSVGSLSEAIGLIGADALLGLVLAAHLFNALPLPGLRIDVLWEHASRVSELGARIARLEGADRRAQGHVALAGLLHDIGLMVFLQNAPGRYQLLLRQSANSELELVRLEREEFGVTHDVLGALVLRLWGLPGEVVDAVASSHRETPVPQSDVGLQGIVNRSLHAAEWLLEPELPQEDCQVPSFLAARSGSTLQRWREERDALAAGVA